MPTSRSRLVRGLAAAAVAATLLVPGTSGAAPADRGGGTWVGSWATAVTPPGGIPGPSETGFTETTLRQVVHLSAGGDQVRIRLSNVYGETPLQVAAATVALRGPGGGATVAGTPVPVTFAGSRAVTIAPGTERVSDPVGFPVADDSDLVLSTYLPGPTGPVTQHAFAFSTTFATPGDATAGGGAAYTPLGTSWFILDGVDVHTRSSGSVVLFGDSITDGVASTVDANRRYGDYLADRTLAGPDRREIAVLNAGIGGNRLLADGEGGFGGFAGDSALARFERDVLGQPGVRTVILLEGINDIGISGGAVDPAELIAVYQQFIARAQDAGIRVLGGTLLPYEGAAYFSAAGEQDRQAVNTWIRTGGEFDGVVDFDEAMRDPQHPTRLLPAYDAGDHLHPNDAGFAAMAQAVDVAALR